LGFYNNIRQQSDCYNANTLDQLGQTVSGLLEQVNWDQLSVAQIADVQSNLSLPMPNSLRASLQQRIATPEQAVFTKSSVPLVRFLGYSIRSIAANETNGKSTDVELYFEPIIPISSDLTVWLHGTALISSNLSLDRRQYGYANFDHQPLVPTSHWQPGQIYVSVYHLQASSDTYQLQFGLYNPDPFEILDSGRALNLAVGDAP
jgi:hypothetical protein